jgi:hypothetical protein
MFDNEFVEARFLVLIEGDGRLLSYTGPVRKADLVDIQLALESLRALKMPGTRGLSVAGLIRRRLPTNIPTEGRLVLVETVK